ncbi:MAG: 2-C-methyl-D-erythritol 4-phosphate cytidylyltransferase [Actinomycetes bacterium]
MSRSSPLPREAHVRGRVAALVPAAGSWSRLGAGQASALVLVDGVPLVVHAVRALSSSRWVSSIVVAAPATQVDEFSVLVATLVASGPGAVEVRVVAGGVDRRASVELALNACPAAVEVVLVHDVARALAPVGLVDRVAQAVLAGAPAVVPGVLLTDTVKQVDRDDVVQETPDRASLRSIQTPQGFRRDVLLRAHREADARRTPAVTDDAGMVEALGIPVVVVPGHEEAFTVTRPLDLLLAAAVLERRRIAPAAARERQ